MNWIRSIRRSLKWKFIVLVTLLIICLVSSIGYFSYYESSRTIRNDVALFSEQILKQANFNLNQYFLDYEYGFLLFGLSYEYQQWLSAGEEEKYERFMLENRLESKFVLPFMSQFPDLLSLSLYSYDEFEKLYRYGQNFPILDYSVTKESWFARIQPSKHIQIFVHPPSQYEESAHPVIITMVKTFDYGDSSGFIKIDIAPSRALQILNQIDLGANSTSLIVDDQGQVLLEPKDRQSRLSSEIFQNVSRWNKDADSFYNKATEEMVMFQTLPYTGWKTMVIVPYHEVAEGIYRVRSFTIAVAVINFICAVVAVWMISSSLTSRLLRLKEWIKQTQMGHLEKRIGIEGIDEVAELGAAYNRMLDELDGSMHNLAEARLLQRQAVQSALQSQIHSHFLYNALEAINAMANLAEHRDIMDTTVALSDMLRYTSNYEQELVPLRDEMKHAGDYISIMNIVYGNRIRLVARLPEALEGRLCLKAVVQPMIENSVKHGIEKTGAPMTIVVAAEMLEGQYLRLSVQDDGPGFEAGKLEKLQSMMAAAGRPGDYRSMPRVGLLNVHYRIRLYYRNERCGVEVGNGVNGLGDGAVVSMIFPLSHDSMSRQEE